MARFYFVQLFDGSEWRINEGLATATNTKYPARTVSVDEIELQIEYAYVVEAKSAEDAESPVNDPAKTWAGPDAQTIARNVANRK